MRPTRPPPMPRRRAVVAQMAAGLLPGAALAPSARAASAAAATGAAGELRIALSYDPSSLDPHFAATAGNITVSSHFFECLVGVDADGQFVPGLATKWAPTAATTWEVRLRRGVRFHDGSPLTAEDVAFSLQRPAKVLNSPGPFTSYTKPIQRIEQVDAFTLRLHTAEPYGPLPGDLASVFIVSKRAAESARTDDFNSGQAMVGTGPFVFRSYKRGDRISMVRHAGYWGPAPAWEQVAIRFIPSDPARVAALLAGDVDMVEGVPPSDLPRLQLDRRLQVVHRSTWRSLFLHLNHAATDESPVFLGADGRPLGRNPLKDRRVRQALSMALSREALVHATLEDFGAPSTQLVAPGLTGFDPGLKSPAYDVAGARKLLAEAGLPDGFRLLLAVPNNRYVNDDQIGQSIGQLWSRIGVKVDLQAMPMATYVPKMKSGQFGAALLGWGTLAADFGLRTLLGTQDASKGWGTWNWGRYSNAALDERVQSALRSTDAARRDALAREAMALAMQDVAVIPTHYQFASWAMRRGLAYPGRLDEFTFAHSIRKV